MALYDHLLNHNFICASEPEDRRFDFIGFGIVQQILECLVLAIAFDKNSGGLPN